MRALLENPVWRKAKNDRKFQRFFGAVSGVFFAIALLALADGLIAQMRGGNNELRMLAGESVTLSGPAALKNPVNSDVLARFSPTDSDLRFELEGFFTGYWFGSGMWRGQVIAPENTSPGRYQLRISFRGTAAKNAQTYIFDVYANAADMRAASLSLIRRLFDVNPFILACWAAVCALAAGAATYWHGRAYALRLREIGLAQIWTSNGAELCCLAPAALAPQPGNARMLLDPDGRLIGEARTIRWEKGKVYLNMLDETEPPAGALICLRHPENQD